MHSDGESSSASYGICLHCILMKWCKKQIKNTSQASIWGTYWPVFMGSDVPSDAQAELIQPQAPQTIFPMDGRADVGGRCALRRAQTQKTNQSKDGAGCENRQEDACRSQPFRATERSFLGVSSFLAKEFLNGELFFFSGEL